MVHFTDSTLHLWHLCKCVLLKLVNQSEYNVRVLVSPTLVASLHHVRLAIFQHGGYFGATWFGCLVKRHVCLFWLSAHECIKSQFFFLFLGICSCVEGLSYDPVEFAGLRVLRF